ncbi:MAG: ABC transporter ATP-binding protein [Lentisphaeria bacterium]|nr:ABC transporter ATP-binding protein [Lentisphaeria bacterium]
MYRIGQLPRLMLETSAMLVALAFFAIMLYWGYSEARIQINFVMLVVVMARALPSLGRMHYNLTQIRQTLPLLESVYPDLLLNPPQPDPTVAPLPLDQSLELQQITFRYPNGKQIFDRYSCTVRACESVAVIGKTGRGKTTVADLLLGLLQPDSGKILADGVDIATAPDRWRKSIGYVPQHIVLLNSSIRENIAFGVPPELIDDAKVLRALRRAQLLDFVNTLPEGLDFFVGDNGNRLSGGQRQRLGIARALYSEPRLLVLDEATSALDTDTESAVVAALNELRGSLTMIVIAHRLTTIEQCDRILDLDSVL